jgi:hypothetical protein
MKKYTTAILLMLLAACNSQTMHTTIGYDLRAVRPAYRLATNTIAVLFTGEDSATVFGTAYSQAPPVDSYAYTQVHALPHNCSWVDTSGPFRLFTSPAVQLLVAQALKDSCYIYGTKGIALCKAGRILLSFDECRENIYGFEVTGYDTNRYGNPLFQSFHYIPIDYSANIKEVQSKVSKLVAGEQNDYRNNLSAVLFAKLDSFYFGYEDDFVWHREERDTICYLPTRYIFVQQNNGKVRRSWTHDIDLIGIPCD